MNRKEFCKEKNEDRSKELILLEQNNLIVIHDPVGNSVFSSMNQIKWLYTLQIFPSRDRHLLPFVFGGYFSSVPGNNLCLISYSLKGIYEY